jgi:hypothetical protein
MDSSNTVIWPEYISLKDWAAHLQASYADQFLPILNDETKWEEWATIVVSSGIFEEAKIPSPFTISEGKKTSRFQNWREWAVIVYTNILNLNLNQANGNV